MRFVHFAAAGFMRGDLFPAAGSLRRMKMGRLKKAPGCLAVLCAVCLCMLFAGKCPVRAQAAETAHIAGRSDVSKTQVKTLKSRAAAYKAALTALKNGDCKTKFYSETSYYPIFLLMLRQHPEYNYNTAVWKKSDGTYGYGVSSELTETEQAQKMRAAEKKAESVIKKIIKPKMTAVQKVRAIHDYVVRRCSFDHEMQPTDGYEDSLTAYGALLKRKAVCQGYAGAFNLLAQKAGIYAIAVCGTAGGGTHAWNYVKIGGSYRYVDCTWDDVLQKGKQICYEYFNISGKLIATNHYWKKEQFRRGYIKYCKYLAQGREV